MRGNWAASIKADIGRIDDQGVIVETFVASSIRHNEQIVAKNGMATEGNIPCRFSQLDPQRGFKPLTLGIYNADYCNWHIEQTPGQAC